MAKTPTAIAQAAFEASLGVGSRIFLRHRYVERCHNSGALVSSDPGTRVRIIGIEDFCDFPCGGRMFQAVFLADYTDKTGQTVDALICRLLPADMLRPKGDFKSYLNKK